MIDINGAWFARGDVNRPCAVFQAGGVLLLVNDKGSLAKGRFSDPTQPTSSRSTRARSGTRRLARCRA